MIVKPLIPFVSFFVTILLIILLLPQQNNKNIANAFFHQKIGHNIPSTPQLNTITKSPRQYSTTTTTTRRRNTSTRLRLFWEKQETSKVSSNDVNSAISDAIEILNRAAETKSEDPDLVFTALGDLEKLMRKKCQAEPQTASDILQNLNGDWRLIFTTGTDTSQNRLKGRVNYFPIKAVQSFDSTTDPYSIQNGIYVGDFALVKFDGYFIFDLDKRKLEFDFTSITILGFKIEIKKDTAAKIGQSTGLGSSNAVSRAEKGKMPFFNWISADETIATARGGGGGLALWKRI